MNINTPENTPETISTQSVVDTNPTQQNNDPNVTQQPIELSEDPNWKAVREARKQERKEREEAQRIARDKAAEVEAYKIAMEALLNKQQPQQQYQGYQDSEEETEEQRIDKRVAQALAKREAELNRQRQEREHQEYPQKLQQQYTDFNQVTNEENLDYLDYHFPEVAGPLKRAPDGFDKWSDIYKAIKRFVPNMNPKKDAARAAENFNKPKSMSTISVTEKGENPYPIRIDEAKRASNWERMQRTMNKLS